MILSKKLILASNSPRRKEILANAGFEFDVKVKETDEDFPNDMPAEEVPRYLAIKKNKAFEGEIGDKIILTADTIVAVDGEILNKPADKSEAISMLKKLSGRKHFVYTGVCICTSEQETSFVDTTEVYFKPLTDQEINYYIATCRPFDKAGAYGVQDFIGMVGIEKIIGSYYTVMGLPIHSVYNVLKKYIVIEKNDD
jgi:septum formation protein